jgi:hypothetical protein
MMKPAIQSRIDDVKSEINGSPLADADKDCLKETLDAAAEVSNGHPDKIQGMTDLLRDLVILDVRRAARLPKEVEGEVRRQMVIHVANCPMSSSTLPKAIAWAYPIRWQVTIIIAVLCFAPQAPVVIGALMKLTGN